MEVGEGWRRGEEVCVVGISRKASIVGPQQPVCLPSGSITALPSPWPSNRMVVLEGCLRPFRCGVDVCWILLQSLMAHGTIAGKEKWDWDFRHL